jgi:hypothetical protein
VNFSAVILVFLFNFVSRLIEVLFDGQQFIVVEGRLKRVLGPVASTLVNLNAGLK